MLYFTLSDVLALPYYYTRTRLHQLLHEMGLKSRTSFLRKGAERHTTDDTPCCICHETIAKKSTFWYLCAQLRNTRNATRNFVLRGHAGGSKTLTPRAESSPWNCMMRIKRCGHCFCYDCLETWTAAEIFTGVIQAKRAFVSGQRGRES
ncbi:uncharacterized protein SETTUDRAFT_18608 [Exserohilum turcica Et28A]|uniref:RING-type domain-containing protein n=1 Tax=Exserohilum turcicum (strain 28A) TaxID=671987 RepID=R0KSJ9_EXST2|nr:uncharacterized protein SETTUDRAFT_18608 [Exserohilum turcica Et28A]EOA91949.1 hypothetical protein SETTUDRAFT_18608 [Exserohilum turcica Et28A]